MRTRWADDDAGALADALGDLESPLLFGGAPALVIRRAEALGGAEEAHVLQTAGRIRPPACLVLVARALDARRTLRTAFDRQGAVVACPRVTDQRALRSWGERLARERGHAIRPAALDLLLTRTSLDLAGLASELDKVSLYAGAGTTIERSHVETVACLGQQAAVEAVTDALARGEGAHGAVAALLEAGEPPIRLVAFLAANLRRALHVAELRERGVAEDAIAARLGMPPWLIRRVRTSRAAAELECSLDALRTLDLRLKRSVPPAAAFHAALQTLGAPTQQRRS